MKIYLASSWRNVSQPELVAWLRERGHDCYDFKNPPSRTGFSWQQTINGRPSRPSELTATLNDPIAEAGFHSDMDALKACDVCILLMPAGISANLELGWAAGAGKTTIVYIPDDAYAFIGIGGDMSIPIADRPFEPELMWKMADHIATSNEEFIELWIHAIEKEMAA